MKFLLTALFLLGYATAAVQDAVTSLCAVQPAAEAPLESALNDGELTLTTVLAPIVPAHVFESRPFEAVPPTGPSREVPLEPPRLA